MRLNGGGRMETNGGKKPQLVKTGMAVALSGYFLSQLRSRQAIVGAADPHRRPPPPSSGASKVEEGRKKGGGELKDGLRVMKCANSTPNFTCGTITSSILGFPHAKAPQEAVGYSLADFDELVIEEFGSRGKEQDKPETHLNRENKRLLDMKQEIAEIRNSVKSFHDRERKLEIQLQEYSSLKEHHALVKELENRIKIFEMEAQLSAMKIESLQVGNKRLEAQASAYLRVTAELDVAAEENKLLKRKLKSFSWQAKAKVASLHKQLVAMRRNERQSQMQNLDRLKNMENEAANIRRENSRLAQENLDLSKKLESTRILAEAEAHMASSKMESLQNNNKLLEAQVAAYSRVTSELNTTRVKVKFFKRKLRLTSWQAKVKAASLHKRIAVLQYHKDAMHQHVQDIERKLDRMKSLEDEAVDLRRENLKPKQENLDLIKKLESNEILVPVISEFSEGYGAHEELIQLRQRNNELMEEIEQVRSDQCSDVEELVYLRWINACLRYELQNKPTPGKITASKLNKNMSLKSAEKAKELILEYAYSSHDEECPTDMDLKYCSSSQSSTLVEIEELDDATSNTKDNNPSSSKFFGKLKKLVTRKDSQRRNTKISSEEPRARPISSAKIEPTLISPPDDVMGRDSFESTSSNFITDHAQGRHSSTTDTRTVELHHLNMKPGGAKVIEGGRCRSDLGSSCGHKRFISSETTSRDSETQQSGHGPSDATKADLKKFASALKNSNHVMRPYRTSSFRLC